MKLHLILATILMSSVAHAGAFSDLNLHNLIYEYGRAEFEINTYKGKPWGKEINQLKKRHSSDDCGPAQVSVGRTDALLAIQNYFEEYELAAALKKLQKSNQLIYAIYATDGQDGDSEYCSTSTFRFYSNDGEVLELFYDYNT